MIIGYIHTDKALVSDSHVRYNSYDIREHNIGSERIVYYKAM